MNRAALAFCLLLLGAASAHAGYYATILSSNSQTYWPVGRVSGCYLLPSMAGGYIGTYSGIVPVVSAVDATAHTITFQFGGWAVWSVSYADCTAIPAVTPLPSYLGNLADPAISNNSISGGSGGSGGVSTPIPVNVTVTASPATVEPVQPERAVADASALFGIGIGFLFLIWAGKRIYKLFTTDIAL